MGFDNGQAFLYTGGEDVSNTFAFAPGVCVLPLAEDPPTDEGELAAYSPVVVLRLHAPYRLRRTVYSAEKQNAPPVMPRPDDTGKFVFLGGAMALRTIENQTFMLFDWQVSSQYDYVENCVSRPEDGLVLGTVPWFRNSTTEAAEIFPPVSSAIGAIGAAGEEAKIGYTMSRGIVLDGESPYVYNIPSYYPGVFFSDDLANGSVT